MSAESLASSGRTRPGGAGVLAGVGSGLLLGTLMLLVAIAAIAGASLEGSSGVEAQTGGLSPSALARREIPSPYLRAYEQAAQRYDLDWAILAGIGKVECDHGRDPDPSCAREGATNAAGAGGPMQFLAGTWASYGEDGDGDGRGDRWDATDAIFGAANYLAHAGAPRDYRAALLTYNHAGWYVEEVEQWAARYRGSSLANVTDTELFAARPDEPAAGPDTRLGAETTTQVRFVAGRRAALSSLDAHQALVPAAAPPSVQAMIVAGNELQSLPYGPGGHPDPRGALEEDCSSTVNYVLYRAGIRPIDEILAKNPLAQDYVDWGEPGPGRWVTIYATRQSTDHVFITVAGLRLDTSHDGTDTGPNQLEGGPRWRLLDRIPGWAHWSIRHPPGL